MNAPEPTAVSTDVSTAAAAPVEQPAEAAACEACRAAWSERHSGLMHARCVSCIARALADSAQAFAALRSRDATTLRAMVQSALPAAQHDLGRALVWAWVRRRREQARAWALPLETKA